MSEADPDAHLMRVLFDVHSDLPRQAPGDAESTLAALQACSGLGDAPRVLDVGCGPGAQTLALAEALPGAHLTAVDLHQPYLDEVEARARAAGVSDRIETRCADMGQLPFEAGAFDLIWAEGSAYVLGIEAALAAWLPLLAPGGWLALTELVWLTDDPPAEAAGFWAGEYPAMTTVEAVAAEIEAAGYTLSSHFTLPDASWWRDYYTPLSTRLDRLEQKYAGDDVAQELMAGTRREIAMRERFGDTYGYHFFVARKNGD